MEKQNESPGPFRGRSPSLSPLTAVALRYLPPQDKAPKVVAKGKGSVAEKIIEIARARGIPLREDPDLVRLLSLLDLDEEIPPSLYPVVAEILAFVYALKKKWKDRKR